MMVCIEWPDGYTVLEPSNKSFLALIKLYDPFWWVPDWASSVAGL